MKHAFILLLLTLSLGAHVTAPLAMADVVPGQVDDFGEGTTLGWVHGMPNPDAPRVVADGGPNGTNDAFLRVSSHGGFGPGGKLIMFTDEDRWTGSYGDDASLDRVVGLEVDFNNLGQEPLTLWFSLDGEYTSDEGASIFASLYTDSFELAPGSGWQHASFSLLPEDLTSNGDASKILSNVTRMWLFHNTDEAIHPGPEVVGDLGMDNLTAVGDVIIENPPGDYNNNGSVEQADLDLVLLNWGRPGTPPPNNWDNDLPEGNIDQNELDGVLLNWGQSAESIGAASIPEPATWMLLGLAASLLPLRLTRRRVEQANRHGLLAGAHWRLTTS